MLILRAATAAVVFVFAALAAASSNHRSPLRRIALAKNADVLTQNHRVTALSTFDVAFHVGSQPIRLSLEPNHDILAQGAVVTHLDAQGRVSMQAPIDRLQHKIFKGTTWVKRGNRWDRAGWARIEVRRDGLEPLFEGTFTMDHDHHHMLLASNYKKTRLDADPDIDLRDKEVMVVFRDSDMGLLDERPELKKRGSDAVSCASDSLGFNNQEDHPVYEAMRVRRSDKFASMPFSHLMGKRQLDGLPGGGNGAGVNLVQSIGSTAGCPSTRKVALVGVAADCTYVQDFDGDKNETQNNIVRQINSASEVFESTFNISLGLANLVITDPECPTTPQQATPWNQDCEADGVDIQERLNLFSTWRGQQDDEYSHWTLLSTCNTDTAVGLAWLGQACTQGSQPSNSSQGDAEQVAGANVVIKTSTEWQVIAHETGHTYGAVHDCNSDLCQNQDLVSAQQCCPLDADTCDAGRRFIMNPSTQQGIERFSPCSIGNVCSALGRNSVQSSCLSNNRDVTTISGQTCGNGIVEGDEQCDCGGENGCGDNQCCDPETCRFRDNAVCDDSNEDCCRDCQFASSQTVCRPSAGDCDPEERCTGDSSYCPEDETQEDGSDCGNGLQCASGQCTSRDQQCRTIMGSYTEGNDTYACDNSNCMLSCASPEFGRGVCYGLQQNFLDGTSCTGGGTCQNGRCEGGSFGNAVGDWFDRHRTLVIALASSIGGLLVLCIVGCCWRSYRRRSKRRIYAKNAAAAAAAYNNRNGSGSQSRSRSRRGGPPGPPGGPPMAYQPYNVPSPPPSNFGGPSPGNNNWQPPTSHGVPPPPPMFQRSSSIRYA